MAQSLPDREALAASFDRHAEEEGKILAEYQAMADRLGASPARFLVKLIVTEEELHHQFFRAAARWLREPAAPGERGGGPNGSVDELVRRTEQLQEHEKQTIEVCRRLESELSGAGGEILASVIEVMAMDSEKHHRLLERVKRILAG
jgi:hypothetical protein